MIHEISGLRMGLVGRRTVKVLPWPGIITGVLIVGIYFWCTNQFIIQRALGARSLEHGRRGSLLAGLLKLPNLFILILPRVMARMLYPDPDNPDMIFPLLVLDMLPFGGLKPYILLICYGIGTTAINRLLCWW